jgi:hypothetical protein
MGYEHVKKLPPEKRREINARYYRRYKLTPAKRVTDKRWRDKNRDLVNESAKQYYWRNVEDIRFKSWLGNLLKRVARECERKYGRGNCV